MTLRAVQLRCSRQNADAANIERIIRSRIQQSTWQAGPPAEEHPELRHGRSSSIWKSCHPARLNDIHRVGDLVVRFLIRKSKAAASFSNVSVGAAKSHGNPCVP
jgi:hypothetical protein